MHPKKSKYGIFRELLKVQIKIKRRWGLKGTQEHGSAMGVKPALIKCEDFKQNVNKAKLTSKKKSEFLNRRYLFSYQRFTCLKLQLCMWSCYTYLSAPSNSNKTFNFLQKVNKCWTVAGWETQQQSIVWFLHFGYCKDWKQDIDCDQPDDA